MTGGKDRKKKTLSKRQLRLIEELFESGLDEASVLSRLGVSRGLFRKWLADEAFAAELQFRLDSARRQSRLIIARYAPVAAAKLVALTESQGQETARKACLDIISLPFANDESGDKSASQQAPAGDSHEQLSPELASRLLAALANEEKREKKF
jgi:hypothetical protein